MVIITVAVIHSVYRLVVLPSPVKRDGEGQEIRRYLTYITTDKVYRVYTCSYNNKKLRIDATQ